MVCCVPHWGQRWRKKTFNRLFFSTFWKKRESFFVFLYFLRYIEDIKLSNHNLDVFFSWCQIVLVPNCPVSNCPFFNSWCQIVPCQIVRVPNCPVPNCPVPNCPTTCFWILKIKIKMRMVLMFAAFSSLLFREKTNREGAISS